MRKLGKIVLATLIGAMILVCASCKTEVNSVSGATFKLSEYVIGDFETPKSDLDEETIKFNKNGTYVFHKEGEEDENGKWKQDGDEITLDIGGAGILKYTMTVSSDGSILTWKFGFVGYEEKPVYKTYTRI